MQVNGGGRCGIPAYRTSARRAGAIRSRSSSDTGNIGETSRASAPERCSPAIPDGVLDAVRDDDRRGAEQRREPPGRRAEEDDEASGPPRLRARLPEQTLLLG